MRVVFFNGPPHSGKDTAIEWLGRRLKFHHLKFAAPLKAQLCALLDCTLEWLEAHKDEPHPALKGGTPRNYLIGLSENFIKPTYGDDFFGHVAADKLRRIRDTSAILPEQYIFFSDSGFHAEAVPVVKLVGIQNCMKIEMHRPGKDFSKDSRSYWSMSGLRNVLVANSTEIEPMCKATYDVIRDWMEEFKPLYI